MEKKVMTIVGARPQFIKAAVVSHALCSIPDIKQVLVHTGQHYDQNMSQVFFDELSIPAPDMNLGISGGSHAEMTGEMLKALERVMLNEQPDCVLLFGDTNSTLAGALAAAKLHIPVIHVEAGARTGSKANPEEINRVCTDHVSTMLLACTQKNFENLEHEGLGAQARFVGDPMYDAFLEYINIAREPKLAVLGSGSPVPMPEEFYYLTCHREENTADLEVLKNIWGGVIDLSAPVIYPVHPRNKETVLQMLDQRLMENILFVEPVGYLESIYLVSHARQVITDSGGLQREAFFAKTKCVTVLDFEVWPETMVGNRNVLAKPESYSILDALQLEQHIDDAYQPFGDGCSSHRIADALVSLTSRA